MWTKILVALILTTTTNGFTLEEGLVTSSLDFLDKYSQKQYRNIVSLTVSNASITKIDPRLKYFKNLRYLDLSHNNIQLSTIPMLNSLKVLKLNANNFKSIDMSLLPPNIESLDLSNNLLHNIPKDWQILKSLKVLHLHKNPIDCDYSNILTYKHLLKDHITIPEPLLCQSPRKYSGKTLSAVNCSLDDIMLYDEADTGSGSNDIFDDILHNSKHIPLFEEEEQKSNFTIIDDLIEVPQNTEQPSEDNALDEGSGDDGSGHIIKMPDSGILGCIENCSTPPPVGQDDEEHASPLPSPFDQLRMVLSDLNPFKEFDDTSTTSTTTMRHTTKTTTFPSVIKKDNVEVKEPVVSKNDDKSKVLAEKTDSNNNETAVELERASTAPQNSNAVYAVAAVFTFIAVLFIVCFIKKRRANNRNRKNRRENANIQAEEMKPLSKPSVQTLNDKPVKNAQNIPEHIPLINGQNGASRTDSPRLKSYTPLTHPDKSLPEEETVKPNSPVTANHQEPEVELRSKSSELLTPQTERVTIRESEIPESIPRTPLLVHRQKNSDGQIITIVP